MILFQNLRQCKYSASPAPGRGKSEVNHCNHLHLSSRYIKLIWMCRWKTTEGFTPYTYLNNTVGYEHATVVTLFDIWGLQLTSYLKDRVFPTNIVLCDWNIRGVDICYFNNNFVSTIMCRQHDSTHLILESVAMYS